MKNVAQHAARDPKMRQLFRLFLKRLVELLVELIMKRAESIEDLAPSRRQRS
jgi:hypothetical protein